LDPESGRFSGEVFADVPVLHRIEVFEDKLLVIVPFKKITCYNLEKGALKVVWNFNVESADEAVAWIMRERKTNYYFIIDHNILLLSRRNEEFFFVNIDINTGKEVWEKKLPGIKGLFYDLSSSKKYQDKINFIITTGCEGIIDQMESFPDVSSIFVNSKLCALDFLNGQVSRKDNIASFSQNRWVNKSDLVETRNRYIYIVDCKILVVEDKSQ
jgi:outer membrane protein assembly factor BamB